MADEPKTVNAIMGPYRGRRLQMPPAEADQAINDHWAVDPFSTDPPHDALTEDEREHALRSAHDWAQAQWQGGPPEIEEPPSEGGETRDMTAGEGGEYETRDAPVRRGPGRPRKNP